MKTMKRIMAAVLAIALAVSMMATAVFADESDPKTSMLHISGGEPLDNHTFELYRIFDEEYVTTTKEGETTTSYSYSWNQDSTSKADTYSEDYAPTNTIPKTDELMGDFYAFFFDPAENDEVDEEGNPVARCDENKGLALSTAMKYLHDMTSDAANSLALSLDLKEYIAKHKIQPQAKTPADVTADNAPTFVMDSGSQIFTVQNGYYLIIETTQSGSVSPSILVTVGPSTNVVLKTITPSVKKTVNKVNGNGILANANSTNDGYMVYDGTEGLSVEVGDVVTFRVDMVVPDVKGKNERDFYWYQLVDEGDPNGVLELEDASEYEYFLKNKETGEIEKLKEDIDYVALPHSYKEVIDTLNDTSAENHDHRRIVADLAIYIFSDMKAEDIPNLEDEGEGNRYELAEKLLKVAFQDGKDLDFDSTDEEVKAAVAAAEELYTTFTKHDGVVFRLTTSDKFNAGDTIIVEIEAVVTTEASNGKIENTVELRYTRDPQQHKPTPENIEETPDETPVYTHNIKITKIDSASDAVQLSGAVFEIYKPAYSEEDLDKLEKEKGKDSAEYQAAVRETAAEPLKFIVKESKIFGENGADTGNTESTYTLLAGKYAEEIEKYEADYAKYLDDKKEYDADPAGIEEPTEPTKPEYYDNIVTEVKTDASGNVKLNGLTAGRYVIRETEAPAGYNVPESPFTFKITATYKDDGKLKTLNGSAETGADTATEAVLVAKKVDPDTNSLTATLSNEKGGKLPSTGGNGTMMFTIIGGTFGVIMLALLVNELKKKEN